MTRLAHQIAARIAARDFRREDGQGIVEYGLVLTLVSLGLVAALGVLTGKIDAWIKAITP